MKKYLALFRNLVWFLCILTFVWSCEQASGPPPKPKVIRKKIIARNDQSAETQKVKQTPPVKSQPTAQPQPVTAAPKSQELQQPPQKPTTTSPPLVAKKDETVSPQTPRPQPATAKKPAIGPKSDISILKPPVKQPQPPKAAAPAETDETPEEPSPDMKIAVVPSPYYSPQGRIDPFEPLFQKKREDAKVWTPKRGQRVPRTPLEKIDLSQLKLVAIVLAKSGNRAMVEETSGKGYVIEKGTFIGTNAGKVVTIDFDRVVVKEEFEDNLGNVKVRDTELKLLKPPGEF